MEIISSFQKLPGSRLIVVFFTNLDDLHLCIQQESLSICHQQVTKRIMSKKRGLSFEEKRNRMMEIFFEKKEFFHLKELEKTAPKSKGITPMSVKEVLQSLVDDNLVNCEKVGSSSYFWAFKSQVLNIKQNQLKNLQQKIMEAEEKQKSVQLNIDKAQSERPSCPEREDALKEISILQSKKEEMLIELEKHKENDPAVINKMSDESAMAKEAANRWTDNLFTLKSWIKKKFPIDEKQIDKQFGIPEELDYIE